MVSIVTHQWNGEYYAPNGRGVFKDDPMVAGWPIFKRGQMVDSCSILFQLVDIVAEGLTAVLPGQNIAQSAACCSTGPKDTSAKYIND